MNAKTNVVSYAFAAMAGFSFICGLVILSSEGSL
jgi:hypothetical protein